MRHLSARTLMSCSIVLFSGSHAYAQACSAPKALALENTTITAAELVAPGKLTTPYGDIVDKLPGFCRIAGIMRPTLDSIIRFEVWLPSIEWNGRLLGTGNGGFAGSISYSQMAEALRLGYATAGTDTGHQGDAQDASWAYHHPEKVADYGYRGVHLMTLRAKAIVAAVYGKPQDHAYFDSCSNGGREALMEAQRFPEDYDGILAGAPANDWTHLLTAGLDATKSMTADPAGYISSMKLPAINRATLAACDTLDGVKDGIVSDPERCRFDPAVLLCKADEDVSCLTAPQVVTLTKIYATKFDLNGKEIFPGLVPGAESPVWKSWITGEGPGGGAGYGANYFRYMVTGDPAWDILKADPTESLRQAQAATGRVLDAVDPDLTSFARRGGKLILYHGWNDPAISPFNTIAYVRSVQGKMGPAATNAAVKLYMVPGMEHCANGPGPFVFGQLGLPGARGAGSGILDLLEGWVEKGTAPESVMTARFAPDGKVKTMRPLCPYPQSARYDGKGDPDRPESFRCRVER